MSATDTALRESPIVPDPEALIREARRRQRRRWTAIGAMFVALAVVAVVAFEHRGHTNKPPARRPVVTRHAHPAPPVQAKRIEPKQPGPLAVAPDGTLYIADNTRNQILAFKNGKFRVAVGDGQAGFRGDGGRATKAEINLPEGMVFHDGTLYFADGYNGRVRAVSPSGIITTVAGNGGTARHGWIADGTPALEAALNPSAVTFGPDGAMYVASDPEVLRLEADKTFTRVVGNETYDGVYGVGGRAADAGADSPNGLAFDARGNLFIAGFGGKQILMVDTGGTLHLIGSAYPRGSGGIVTAPDGNALTMTESGVERLTPGGVTSVLSTFGDAFHAVRNFSPNGIALAADGTIYLDTYWGNGYSDRSAIAVIPPGGTPSIVWQHAAPPGA